ncbi:hypothetical protein [Bacteroides acidifaciens]|uniref:hypothetical protein n=1 Tax=Bacteroides acidifaciens TaxID=85831 RepID=UPI00248BE3B2|nr:hypothetical protein [Bacteroides acidifaciens]
MSYYTEFSLNILEADKKWRDHIENEIEKMNVFTDGNYEDGYFAYEKWYDFDKDMRLLSTRFPGTVFELEGIGEEIDDHWLHYYKGGRVMRNGIEIIRHQFDESKLEGKICVDEGQLYSYE